MDIDELKAKIEALSEENHLYKQIIDKIPIHLYWKNNEGAYEGCSRAQATSLGLKSPQEIEGKCLNDLVEGSYVPRLDKNDKRVMRTKKSLTVEEPGYKIHKDELKHAVFLTTKTPLFDKKGNIRGLVGFSQDISEMKKTEFLSSIYFQNILDVLPENFYWVDKNGYVLGCNANQARLFGFNTAEEIIGKTIFDIGKKLGWTKETAKMVRKNDLLVMKTRAQLKAEESCVLDGEARTFLSYKNPLIDKKDKVMGVFGITIDITTQKELENKLREAKEKAEETSNMKSEFIHNMEHDIRTPFAGIHGMSLILARQENDPEKKEALELIAESSKELLDYANHILAFAKIEEDYKIIDSSPFSPKKIVESVFNMEKPAAKAKNIKLSLSINDELPEIVIGDQGRLKGILINLISNAIKFTKKGEVNINLSAKKKNKNSVSICFEVKDTGVGIPKDKQKSIYEKFFRVHPSNQGIYKGFGLGLQVVKKFVDEMQGTIDIDSTVGKGTSFKVTLRFKLPEQA
ncbi:MAG: PAS domain-containing sensor histidine kinase [Gammaproteobacteria bacterium]|nr:PAS domain-containing sensor histidine kinase [Gammaproteobacteria bacterium]